MFVLAFDEFSWQQPVSKKRGFRWEGSGAAARLVPRADATFQAYQPHPGVFRDFADVEPTPTAVLRFANRYGTLRPAQTVEDLGFWQTGIQQMSNLVRISDAVRSADWTKIPEALQPFLDQAALASTEDLRRLVQKKKRREEITRDELAHAAVMRLYHAIDPVGRLTGRGFWNSSTGNVEVRLKAADLLGFMFLQLGGALIQGRRFRQCRACGSWFLLRPGKRADRITCSGYCRLQLYRQRQAQAVALYQRGWAPGKIAKKVGADILKVKNWIAQRET
jgi:hypothetical protein